MLDPASLLAALQAVEHDAYRTRPFRHAPRTLDLDLIFYGDRVIREPHLTVPHPRYRGRLFVLEPLAEIAGEWVDPECGETVAAALARLRAAK